MLVNQKKPSPVDTHVGMRIRLRRAMLAMSQEKLGEYLGVSFQQVQKYEKGLNRVGASRLQRLSEVLEVPVTFFFDDAPGGINGETSSAETAKRDEISDFLYSPDGLQLNRAFMSIADPKVRRRLIDLVRALADAAPLPNGEGETIER